MAMSTCNLTDSNLNMYVSFQTLDCFLGNNNLVADFWL
jgi:hypothetical protein